jgi:NADH-quinone oxidoreductase subunit E
MTTGLVTALPRSEDQDLIDRIIGDQAGRPGALLGILAKLQDHNRDKYLPMADARVRGQAYGHPGVAGLRVATFFALFNLDPQGKHTVAICRGTACHTRGSRALLERVKLQLGMQETATAPTRSR